MSKNKKGDDLFGGMPVTPEFDAFPSEVIASLTGKSPAAKKQAEGAGAKGEAEAEPKAEAETKSGAEPEDKPTAKAKAKAPAKHGGESKPAPAKTGTESGPTAQAEAATETQAKAETEPAQAPAPRPGPKAEPDARPAPEAQAAPEPAPKAPAGPKPAAPGAADEAPEKTAAQPRPPARDAAPAKAPGTDRSVAPEAAPARPAATDISPAAPGEAADTGKAAPGATDAAPTEAPETASTEAPGDAPEDTPGDAPEDTSADTSAEAPGEAAPPSPLEAMLLSRPSPAALAAMAAVFLAGLVLGLWAFMPWNGLWAQAMEALDARLPGAVLSWEAVEDAGPGGATFRGLEADLRGRRVVLDNAALALGLARPLTLALGTGGRTLVVGMGYTGRVTLDGTLDLGAALPGQDSEGVVEITAAIDPDGRGALPAAADLALACERGKLAGTPLEGLLLQIRISEKTLTLAQCTMKRPLALTVNGSASLQRDNPGQSAYNIGGTITINGNSSPYAKSGVLADLSGLLTGDLGALTR